ncbi:hypothetical protein HELRODRAFT_158397 [Helobdella robusta]|uniref:Uncharacterized protein n=1 Tax=Helobdella robusta TaxID=6412 RepID=T1EMR3_HELRO|nr:hypothetical protein HELRODRAFT_158397 [Helobdella robusta]ESO12008.1 hypothetical protein HELRODRAFT_158397 [Helobdella robusta]
MPNVQQHTDLFAPIQIITILSPFNTSIQKAKCPTCVLRSALNFVSDGEVVRKVGREFQRKRPEKAKADSAKECLTRVKKREQENDRKPAVYVQLIYLIITSRHIPSSPWFDDECRELKRECHKYDPA